MTRYSSVEVYRGGYPGGPGQRRSYTDRERAPTPTDEEDSLGEDGKSVIMVPTSRVHFPSQGEVREFKYIGKVGEFYYEYWKSQGNCICSIDFVFGEIHKIRH